LSGVSRRFGVLSVEATYQQLSAPRVSFIIEATRTADYLCQYHPHATNYLR
jgi:hypothetical protein